MASVVMYKAIDPKTVSVNEIILVEFFTTHGIEWFYCRRKTYPMLRTRPMRKETEPYIQRLPGDNFNVRNDSTR